MVGVLHTTHVAEVGVRDGNHSHPRAVALHKDRLLVPARYSRAPAGVIAVRAYGMHYQCLVAGPCHHPAVCETRNGYSEEDPKGRPLPEVGVVGHVHHYSKVRVLCAEVQGWKRQDPGEPRVS
jgi:hypothetical protein